MLRTVGLTRGFAGQPLFDEVDWYIGDRDRIGLIGPNGSGKSTWLKMLAGQESPDAGRLEAPKGQRVGYLPQFAFDLGRGTVREEARAAFAPVLELKRRMEEIERALDGAQVQAVAPEATRNAGDAGVSPVVPASPSLRDGSGAHAGEDAGIADDASADTATLLERYTRLEEDFRMRDGYEIDRQVDRVLRGLGFTLADFDRPVETFSGGWRMRVSLARLLLARPDVLLLDEPTNHLDLEAREWLEGFLREYPGAFVVVSHDRYFLDQTVTRITEIWQRQMVDYEGSFSRYLREREVRFEAALKAWERQQEEIARVTRFIDRFRAKNTKATQVQSRIKMLEKMPKLEKPVQPSRSVVFRFPQPTRAARMALELHGVTKAYGENCVLRAVSLGIERGQKVALVGPNGAGKSTLMKVLAGEEVYQSGERAVGPKVSLDFFAQDAADRLPKDLTILQHAMACAPSDFVPQVRGLLGAFLFSGETVDKRIGVLSGGERNRLALALMLMRPANVLLLDEPTNHLDMAAKDVLLEALQSYEGTVVFVSHDRYFLESLADRVVEVGGGDLYDYPGGYEGFVYQKAQRAAADAAANAIPVVRGGDGGGTAGTSAGAQQNAASDGARGGKKSSPRAVRALEEKIGKLEERKARLEALLADGEIYQDQEKSSFYMTEYREISQQLEEAVDAWANLAEEV